MPGRLAYLSGPIDAERVYRDYREGRNPCYFGTIYLAQLLKELDIMGADGLIITTMPGRGMRREHDNLLIVNIPMPAGRRGALYHVAMMVWAARCIGEIIRFRPDAALLTAGQDYFWMYRVLSLWGIQLIASLHCVLWPKLAPRRVHQRIFARLNGTFFFPACDHIQGVSQDILDQVSEVSVKLRRPPRKFLPTYDAHRFSNVQPRSPPRRGRPFNLLYVGRLEANKGVFDLLGIMRELQKGDPGRYVLDICGSGTAHDQLQSEIAANGMGRMVRLHGECDAASLADKYRTTHAVVVPTRSDFEEGYAKVAAEAVLNLRPVVTSAACPALADIRLAAVEAMVDHVADYARAIQLLANDPATFAAKVRGARACREIYFNEASSYGSILEPALRRVLQGELKRQLA